MAKKSKLLSALDAHKNRDYGLERQKKMQKAAEKKKRAKNVGDEDEGDEVEGQDVCFSIGMMDGVIEGLWLMFTCRKLPLSKN